jgi:magnesium transporter
VEDYSDDDSDESSEYQDVPRQQDTRNAFSQDTDSTIDALEKAAEHHRREAIKCRERLQQLSQQPMASSERLQHLATEVHRHETAYENARENLKLLRDKGNRSSQNGSQRSEQRRSSFAFEDGHFARFPQDDFETFFFGPRRSQHSGYGEQFAFGFDPLPGMPFNSTFHSFFNGFGGSSFVRGMPPSFSMPGASFSFGPQPNARSTPHSSSFQPQGFSNFTAQQPPTPPANLLKPEEAKRLFKTYNERWNSLGPTDPNIPYPARKLHPNGLLARDSIWAPMVSTSITAWSEETIMQANAQAFYLGVVGLSPQYTEAPGTGKIVIAYSKTKATPAQIKELVDILKKEKARWHSDRLGRRNGGQPGTNEALQRDEKARAVFHAVCELMETAQGV